MRRAFMLGAAALVASCVFHRTSLLSAVAFVKPFHPLLPEYSPAEITRGRTPGPTVRRLA